MATTGFRESEQDDRIEQNALATSVISKALADAQAEITETVAGVLENNAAMQAELVAQRRDIERLKDERQ